MFPGQITLIAIGPLSNVGALIDKDASLFRALKRVVMMGGWVGTVGDVVGDAVRPEPEYNVMMDIQSAKKLFGSGVPIYVIPVDSTYHLALDEIKRRSLFSEATPITDSLALLYLLWGKTTPTLYDVMAVAFTVNPALCPMQPMRLAVSENGVTQVETGSPNAQVCLRADPQAFFDYFMRRMANSDHMAGSGLAAIK
jgi:inosine-uridine nucleoside N-ribohydrolase